MAYGAATNTKTNTSTGNNNIDALISEKRWASTNVTFSFTSNFKNDYEDESGYQNSATHKSSFSTLNNTQRAVMREWTEMFEDVSNLNLVELTRSSDRNATIRIAESNDPDNAYAYTPDKYVESGDIWFNKTNYNSPVIGNYAYHTFGHELGHALGLEHGHEIGGVRNVAMNYNRNSMEFSIMTYRDHIGDTDGGYQNESWGYAQSLMMYDIAAIQKMYGADFVTNSGNTTYSFSTATGEMFVNGVGQGTPGGNNVFRTIWDGNGIDTYSFTNYTTDLSIDLTPGGWTNLDTNGNFQKVELDDGNNIFARGHVFNALQFNGDNRSLIENANGGSGDDLIKGNSARNILRGNGGNDTLVGGAGRDTIFGGSGNDNIRSDGDGGFYYGDGGNDSMYSSDLGVETMNGGSGIDFINHTAFDGNYTFNMATGKTNYSGESFVNFERAIMGDGNDKVTGNASANIINGGKGNDTLVGGAGRDTIFGGSGNDRISSDGDGGLYYGEGGNDAMFSGLGGESMNGGSGIDTINHTAWNGNYEFNMATGKTNFGGESFVNFEHAVMGNGNDKVTGNASDNAIQGRGGNDTLIGGAGRDTIFGGSGNDAIYSDGDGGFYYGDGGNDSMFSGLGGETMNGALGIDTINHTAFNGNYEFDMTTGKTNFSGESFVNFENVVMGNGNDTVTGNASDNSINGGRGNDTLTGGSGADDFIFNSLSEGIDTITDFSWGQNDEIHISKSFGGGLTEGFLQYSQFTFGSSASDSSDRVIYNSSNGGLFFDVDGTGSAAQVQFASVDSGLALIASDFVVV